MEKTLLQKAKEVAVFHKQFKKTTDEDIELALAWVKDEIKTSQITKVFSYKNQNQTKTFLADTLKFYLIKKQNKIL